MSILLRFIRPQAIKSKLKFVAPKDIKIYNKACRSDSAVKNVEKDQVYAKEESWTSYGFDDNDRTKDRHLMHVTLFASITLALVGGGLLCAYMPDPLLKEWAQREAYIQLRHREENGLPLIDRNLVDPAKFNLPSEEELEYTEIVI